MFVQWYMSNMCTVCPVWWAYLFLAHIWQKHVTYMCTWLYSNIYVQKCCPYANVACWLCKLYLQWGSNICSKLYVKHVYSAPCCMVGGSDFIYGTGVYIFHISLWNIWPTVYDTYSQLGGHICFLYIFGNYMNWGFEVGCVLKHLCKNIGSICLFSIMSMWLTFEMWWPYLFSDIC